MLVGVVVFLVGWIYAISEYGFFLGVGLGWFPALVIAWLVMQVFSWIFLLSFTKISAEKLAQTPLPNTSSHPRSKAPIKRIVFAVAVLGSIMFAAYILLESELNGTCDRVRLAREELSETERFFREKGVDDLVMLRSASFGEAVLEYGSEVARQRWLLLDADSELGLADSEARHCF